MPHFRALRVCPFVAVAPQALNPRCGGLAATTSVFDINPGHSHSWQDFRFLAPSGAGFKVVQDDAAQK